MFFDYNSDTYRLLFATVGGLPPTVRGRTEFRVNWPAPSRKRGMEPGAA